MAEENCNNEPSMQSAYEELLTGVYFAEINMDSWALETNKPRELEEKIRVELAQLMKENSSQHVGFLRGLLAAEVITIQCYETLIEKNELTESANQKRLLESRISKASLRCAPSACTCGMS